MIISASLKNGWSTRTISMDVPTIGHPLLPVAFVDARLARPNVFHDISKYPLSETTDVQHDFSTLVDCVNSSSKLSDIERYLEGLSKLVGAHINRCGRLLFCDLLMYVDCLAYLCFATDLMNEQGIVENYPLWVKSIVEKYKNFVKCSSKWGTIEYNGSYNEEDLNSCFQ